MTHTVDILIIITFLIATLVIGIVQGKKVHNISDYALGGRNFSTGALVATIVATWVSGSSFFITLSKTYSNGIYYLIASSGIFISFLIKALVFIPRMGEFIGKTSVAEAMGSLYGNPVRIIVAIAGTIGASGIIAVQFKMFGNIFSYFFDVSSSFIIIISGLVVVIYSSFGGIRAVTFTDVLQFLTFGCGVPLIGVIIWNQFYFNNHTFVQIFSEPQFDFSLLFDLDNPRFWSMLSLLFYFAVPGMGPALFQRFSMGKDIQQAKKAFFISSILIIVAKFVLAWIPIMLFAINPHLKSGELLGYIIDNYTYTGFKGIMIISVIAMAMSTADSYINSSAVLFAHDICVPLKIANKRQLIVSRVFAMFLGISAISLALSTQDLLSMILIANSFYMPIVTAPLVLTILGFRTTSKSILIGMFSGFVITVIWKIFKIKADLIFVSIMVNLTFLLGSHYLLRQAGGWINTKDKSPKPKREKISLAQRISDFSIIELCKKHSPRSELSYTGLGIYLVIYTITTMYSTKVELLKSNGTMILAIYQSMMIVGVILAIYPIWPQIIKKLIIVQVAWPIVIFVMLVFYSAFFVMVSNFHQLQFLIFSLNMIIAILLTGWRFATSMIIAGVYLAVVTYKNYMGIAVLDFSIGSPQFVFMYSILLIGAVIVIFLKPSQDKQALVEQKVGHQASRLSYQKEELFKALNVKYEFLRNLEHETNNPLTGIKSMAEICYNSYDQLSDAQRKDGFKNIHESSIRLYSYISNIVDLSKLTGSKYKFNMEKVDLAQLIYDRVDICKKFHITKEEESKYQFLFEIDEHVIASCDKYYITQVLDNIIINAIQYSDEGTITVQLSKNEKNAIITIQDQGIGISQYDLSNIFGVFTVGEKTKTPAGGRGVGLALCKRVVEMHNGSICAESDGKSGSKFIIHLPL